MSNTVWILKNQSSLYPSVHNSTCLGTYLYSAGIHRRNLLQSFVIMGRVAYFISREAALAKTNTIKKQGEDSGNNEGEWTKKVEIRTRKKFLVVGERLWVLNRGDFNFCFRSSTLLWGWREREEEEGDRQTETERERDREVILLENKWICTQSNNGKVCCCFFLFVLFCFVFAMCSAHSDINDSDLFLHRGRPIKSRYVLM